MKRIITVLVLLVTVTLVGAAVSVPAACAVEDAITVPATDVRSGVLNGNLSGPAGDPDGMGTGDGIAEGSEPIVRSNGSNLDGLGAAEAALLELLSLIELLAL